MFDTRHWQPSVFWPHPDHQDFFYGTLSEYTSICRVLGMTYGGEATVLNNVESPLHCSHSQIQSDWAVVWFNCLMAYQLLMDYLILKFDSFLNVSFTIMRSFLTRFGWICFICLPAFFFFVCTHLYGIEYFYQIQIICTPLHRLK